MYADQDDKTGFYNLMELSEKDLSIIQFGLSSIHLNTNEHVDAYFLQKQIDQDLNEK